MQNDIIVGKNLLETITSALYENPIILFREYVQNSLDAYNEAVNQFNLPEDSNFQVNINIDKNLRKITISDNGYGIFTIDEFRHDMLSFGDSKKADKIQYIGFRGIGRLSALPFCRTLTFKNKAKGNRHLDICKWEGEQYRELLNADIEGDNSFENVVNRIVDINMEQCEDVDSHFFEVIIEDYGIEIEDTVGQANFEEQLRKLLPLKYSSEFSAASKIINKYYEFMNENLMDFMCSVYLNGTELLKNYTNNNILDSDIIFWEIRGKNSEKNKPGDKMGILWFTFNKKMTAVKDGNYGILVRSKNVLMGNNDTFADLCETSKEYVGTYRELTSTLRGVYGELLINSDILKDNARREWFKTDENSIYLKYIIVDFMKRLYNYRYKASQYFRNQTEEPTEKKKTALKKALVELVDIDNNQIDVSSFCAKEKQHSNEKSEDADSTPSLSDEDMPRQSLTKKKFYDEIIVVISDFLNAEKRYDLFLKMRAYIKKYYSNK